MVPRITAGYLGGRILKYPRGGGFRPTMDKVKEALFSMLAEGIGEARVLDLYAASGGLGLEALSRGASRVVFVEKNRQACRLLVENIRSLDLVEQTEVVNEDVRTYLKQSRFQATLVFCDPPYRSGLAAETLALLCKYPGIDEETVIIVEHAADEILDIPLSITVHRSRVYGETKLSFLGKNERGAN